MNNKIKVDTSIFRDYDIRGIYPTQINEKAYYVLGRAITSYLKCEEIAVGYDGRLSSFSLFRSLTQGITDQGTNVVSLGLISTEMLYFASGNYKFSACIIITASHNPAEYNGLKIVAKGVVPLHGEFGLPEIKKLAISQDFPPVVEKGTAGKMDIMDDWIEHALSFINVEKLKNLKVVIDAGNGMGGISWQKLIGRLPVEIIPMYFKPDGNFPHHLADPLKKENILDLQKEIIRKKANLGFAIDGDADRLFVLDEKGKMLSGTVTCAILSKWLLGKYGSSPVLYNAVCGRIVPEIIKKMGGKPIRVRVGHSFIKQYMRKERALFAGEHSGHFYFRDNFNAESALITGLCFLEFLSNENKALSEIVKEIDKYPSSGEINFKIEGVDKIFKMIKNKFSDADSIDEVDGLSVWYSDWWFNLRVSKTEPLLRLNLEADDKTILEEKLRVVENLIIEKRRLKV